jgi:hypothetical protein
MTENTIILFAGAAIVAAVVGLIFPWSHHKDRRHTNNKSAALTKLRRIGSYRGVTVRPGKCAVARRFSGNPSALTRHHRSRGLAAMYSTAPAITMVCWNTANRRGVAHGAAGKRSALAPNTRNAAPGCAATATPTGGILATESRLPGGTPTGFENAGCLWYSLSSLSRR